MTIHAAPDEGGQTDDAPALAVEPEVLHEAGSAAEALITEHEVLLGSAAALHRVPAARPARRRYPPRSASYYDSSLISRERYRL
jgi:hypothetical protein